MPGAHPSVSITNTTQRRVYRLPYEQLARAVLGTRYDLSVAFVGRRRAQSLNEQYRGKSYVPDVLAFPLSPHDGEIVLCPEVIEAHAPRYGNDSRTHTAFLFIHALLHLKGLRHGATMERKERTLLRRFGFAAKRS